VAIAIAELHDEWRGKRVSGVRVLPAAADVLDAQDAR
jgi:hypothetical protein